MSKEQSYQIPVLRRNCLHLHFESMSKLRRSYGNPDKICAENKILVDSVTLRRRKFLYLNDFITFNSRLVPAVTEVLRTDIT